MDFEKNRLLSALSADCLVCFIKKKVQAEERGRKISEEGCVKLG